MCGICGVMYFDNTEVQVSPTFLEGMVSTMKHRGPDGEGVWVSNDEKVGLGHARLSIIDLSVFGAQPMGNEDGTVKLRLMEKFIIIANSGPILKKKDIVLSPNVTPKQSYISLKSVVARSSIF